VISAVCHARCVVWTGDERVFFYNPSQNVSVWDCPEDIEDRGDVKKLMQTPPRLMQQAAVAAAAVTGKTQRKRFVIDSVKAHLFCSTLSWQGLNPSYSATHFSQLASLVNRLGEHAVWA